MHLGLFGVMSYLILYETGKQKLTTKISIYGIIIALMLTVFMGAFTEYLQHILPLNRSGNIYDFIANVAGSLIGIISFSGINRKKWKQPDAN